MAALFDEQAAEAHDKEKVNDKHNNIDNIDTKHNASPPENLIRSDRAPKSGNGDKPPPSARKHACGRRLSAALVRATYYRREYGILNL
jgi:hypothetical protein